MSESKSVGNAGEDIACEYLRSCGFEIKHRNLRVGHREIDAVCEDERYILFVEVKTRRSASRTGRYGSARDAVDGRKLGLLKEAAREYLRAHPTSKRPRIDVIEVYLSGGAREIKHIKNVLG